MSDSSPRRGVSATPASQRNSVVTGESGMGGTCCEYGSHQTASIGRHEENRLRLEDERPRP
jgi:hypothetical protein